MITSMRAVALNGPGPYAHLTDRPIPALAEPGEVLVRVTATGICGTDRAIMLGDFPAVADVVLGHETVGQVTATGPAVTSVAIGDRVVINPTYYCNTCAVCRRGHRSLCPAKAGRELGVDRDGTMAEYVVVPDRFTHPIPAGLSDARAVMVEPLACVLNNLQAAAPRHDDQIMILGGGPIGALCALVLAARGFRPGVIECDPQRASMIGGVLPDTVAVSTGWDTRTRPDVVIDTVGTLPLPGLHVLADAATIVIMGERADAATTMELRTIATRAIRVIGAGPYAPSDFETALDLAAGLPLESLISHRIPLEDATAAFALLGIPDPGQGYNALKVILTVGGDLP